MKDVASFDPSIGVIAKIAHRNVVRAILPRNAPVMPQRKHVARTSAKLCSYAPLYIRTARSVVFWLIPRMFSNFNLPFTWSNCSRVPDTKIEKNGVVMSRDVGGFTNEDNLLILRPQKCHAKYARFHLINGISS